MDLIPETGLDVTGVNLVLQCMAVCFYLLVIRCPHYGTDVLWRGSVLSLPSVRVCAQIVFALWILQAANMQQQTVISQFHLRLRLQIY